MFDTPTSGLYPFVIACKGCHEDIAAPVATLPDEWIIATCPLCGQKRRYLPAEIFSGKVIPSGCGAAGAKSELTDRPHEEGSRSRGAGSESESESESESGSGAKEGDGRAEADDRPVRIDTGDRRADHCGRRAGKGSGYQQTIAKTDRGHQ